MNRRKRKIEAVDAAEPGAGQSQPVRQSAVRAFVAGRKKLIVVVTASVAAVVILFVLIAGNQGFLDMYRLRKQDNARAREIAAARVEIDSLKAEIERLKNDTVFIERVAREKLGMARKGEKVYKFVEE